MTGWRFIKIWLQLQLPKSHHWSVIYKSADIISTLVDRTQLGYIAKHANEW